MDPLAYAMAQDAVKRTQAQFAVPTRGARRPERPAGVASLRTIAARRLRVLADRLEPAPELDRAA